jgi:hypothetical protein
VLASLALPVPKKSRNADARSGVAGPGGAVATSTGNGVPAAEEGGARNSGSGNNKRNKPKAREGRDQQVLSSLALLVQTYKY